MAIKIVKVNLPKSDDKCIVSTTKFICNNIFPVAIKSTNIENVFLLLFAAYQEFDNSYAYFNIMISPDDPFSYDYIKSHELYMDNILRSEERKSIYKEAISNITDSNIFGTNMDLSIDLSHGGYYTCNGFKAIDESHASMVNIYFTSDNYIKIRLYLDKLCSLPMKEYNHELIFLNKKYNNIEFVSINYIKHDGTAKTDNDLMMINHYTMNCGISKYVMNICAPIDQDKVNKLFINPLDFNLYKSFYSDHVFINDIIYEDEYTIILYEERSPIDKSFKSMKALKIDNELINKTNIIDYNNNIYIGE